MARSWELDQMREAQSVIFGLTAKQRERLRKNMSKAVPRDGSSCALAIATKGYVAGPSSFESAYQEDTGTYPDHIRSYTVNSFIRWFDDRTVKHTRRMLRRWIREAGGSK